MVSGSQARYLPFGGFRTEPTQTFTDMGYTGHRANNTGSGDIGLIYMNARFYSPSLNRFISADTIVPDPTNPQSYNRYSYTYNNPIRYIDPTGHFCYDATTNEFSDGDCYDVEQGALLGWLLVALGMKDSAGLTDLDIAGLLLQTAFGLIDDPVVALRAAVEIVRLDSGPDLGLGFEFSDSLFFYRKWTDLQLGDTGFGDLEDTQTPNQVSHFIGIAYIGAYMQRGTSGSGIGQFLAWGNEAQHWDNQSIRQSNIDYDLGIIANNLGTRLEQGWVSGLAVSLAIDDIQNYDYYIQHGSQPESGNWFNVTYQVGVVCADVLGGWCPLN